MPSPKPSPPADDILGSMAAEQDLSLLALAHQRHHFHWSTSKPKPQLATATTSASVNAFYITNAITVNLIAAIIA